MEVCRKERNNHESIKLEVWASDSEGKSVSQKGGDRSCVEEDYILFVTGTKRFTVSIYASVSAGR